VQNPNLLLAALLAGLAAAPCARADAVTDWNTRAGEFVIDAKIGTPPAVRLMAIVQTAVRDGVQRAAAVAGTDPAAIDAAVASANRATLSKLMPTQEAAVGEAYGKALGAIADGPAKAAGIAAGESAAAAVMAARADDGAAAPDRYRPHAAAGAYVPTSYVTVPQWAQRKPWLLSAPAQFRPGAPPALTSPQWARDFNEVRALGGRASTARSAEQTEIARFWEYSLPPIYHGVVRSVALQPGRDVQRNARLFAAVAQAMDDALIAVVDAKYHYNLWRPVTAIRNADLDNNAATELDAGWLPLIDTPMYPEYPAAHAILAATVGTVLKAEVGRAAMPRLSTASPTAVVKGASRHWNSADDFMQEVADARVYDGVHYRFSSDTGLAMGRRIGELAAARLLVAP
jgi:hypothetical protein